MQQGDQPGSPRGAAHDRRPILLVEQQGQQRVVVACCERAGRAGVRRGTPAAQARAAFAAGAVRVEPATPVRDRAALRALAVWAHQFSPIVAVDAPDGLLLDVTGCARVFRGESRLLELIKTRCNDRSFTARAAIAPSFGCAWAAARFGRTNAAVVAEGDEREVLKPMPVRALRVEEEVERALAEVGITRVGELFDLPRSVLPARFGVELLFRLDQALGRAIETIEPVRAIEPPGVERAFDGPSTSLEAIGWCVRELLDELVGELLVRESGVRRLDLTLDRSDLEPARLMVLLSRPNRDAGHLWSLIEPRLANTHLGFGVERVGLVASRLGRLRHEQRVGLQDGGGRDEIGEAEAARLGGELADTLVNRFGRVRVGRAVLASSHIPERASRWEAAAVGDRASGARMEEKHAPLGDRPLVLFDRPEPIEVIAVTPDGPVARVRWGGVEHVAVACVGPERIGAEWWRRAHPTRDYFRVQDEGGQWLWVFRELETGRWFVQGAW